MPVLDITVYYAIHKKLSFNLLHICKGETQTNSLVFIPLIQYSCLAETFIMALQWGKGKGCEGEGWDFLIEIY